MMISIPSVQHWIDYFKNTESSL